MTASASAAAKRRLLIALNTVVIPRIFALRQIASTGGYKIGPPFPIAAPDFPLLSNSAEPRNQGSRGQAVPIDCHRIVESRKVIGTAQPHAEPGGELDPTFVRNGRCL